MQRLAREIGRRFIGALFGCVFGARRAAAPAVHGIPDQRMADMGEVNPNLMRAAGFEPAVHQGGKSPRQFLFAAPFFQHAVMRAGRLALAA